MKKIAMSIFFAIMLLQMGCVRQKAPSFSSMLNSSVGIEVGDIGYASGIIIKVNKNFLPEENEVFVITAFHVASQLAKTTKLMNVIFYKYDHGGNLMGHTKITAFVVAGSEYLDIAVLWLSVPKKVKLTSVVFSNGMLNSIGSKLYACARPGKYRPIINEGILGAWHRLTLFGPLHGIFTGGVSFGSSGGGIFDKEGKCIGIVTGVLGCKVLAKAKDNKYYFKKVYFNYCGAFIPINKKVINKIVGEGIIK